MRVAYQYRTEGFHRRLYRIESMTEGRFRVLRLGLCYPPYTTEGIRSAMESEGPQLRWYLIEEAYTEARAFAVASMHARGDGDFVPLEASRWKTVHA